MRQPTDDEVTIIQHFARIHLDLHLLKQLEELTRQCRERLQGVWDSRGADGADRRYVEEVDVRLRRAVRALTTEYGDVSPEAEVVARLDRVVEDATALANDCRHDLERALDEEGEPITSSNLSELALTIAVMGPTNETYGILDKIRAQRGFTLVAEWVEAKLKRSRGGRPRKEETFRGRKPGDNSVDHCRTAALKKLGLPASRVTRLRTAAKKTPSIP